MKKIEPAVMNLWLALDSWDGVSSTSSRHTLDLSQIACLVNRRFYRQGLNWAVAGFKLHVPALPSGVTLATSAPIYVSKLPNTWVLSNAWEKSMRTWRRMISESSEETVSARPRFEDFKIYADETHHAKGFDANLLPVGYTRGEWIPSKVVIPKTDGTDGSHNREIIAVGASYPGTGPSGLGAVSMIEGYAASRALPAVVDPNIPLDALDINGNNPANWMQALFNEGTDQADQVVSDFVENNQNPYPYEGSIDPATGLPFADTMYPGGANQGSFLELVDSKTLTATTISNTLHFDGGNFPCGLVRFDNQNRYENAQGETEIVQYTLQVQLVPGEHRGYLCEPMTEM